MKNMNNKQSILNEFEGRNLAEIGLSRYIHFEGVSEKRQKLLIDEFGREAETMSFAISDSDLDIQEDDVEDWTSYCEEWSEKDFRCEMEYLVTELFEDQYDLFSLQKVEADEMSSGCQRFLTLEEMKNGLFVSKGVPTYLEGFKGCEKTLKLIEYGEIPGGTPIRIVGIDRCQS